MLKKFKDAKTGLNERVKRTGDSLSKARESSVNSIKSTKDKSKQAIEKHWPVIERVVVDGLIDITEEKLRDEEFLKSSFENAYELLPTAVRFMINRDKFINFCVSRREPILERIESSKAQKALPDKSEDIAEES